MIAYSSVRPSSPNDRRSWRHPSTAPETHASNDEARTGPLDDLRWHWGDAYLISFFEPDVWVAQRRDNCETLRADNPVDLRERITADYTAAPVSRQVAGPARPETPSAP